MAKMTPTVLGLMGERQQQGEGKKSRPKAGRRGEIAIEVIFRRRDDIIENNLSVSALIRIIRAD